ncbi:enoyl-CoA hydratase [Spelaeicoccus albus]|uniref:Probable enoyl-CoA hydratase echA8 n=1 Tax=Spelaeicoccus albus TaxID=1280376 RepID=A0A7Z0IJ80_9MICO|nr:enoyl-CoA hydratase [Spelaeicoccus albus]NYI69243.1 enoyl-CoA hydratase [Spelaeicoccus albus]
MTETLRVDRDPAGYALVTLDRPKALNALNLQTLNEVVTAFAELDADPSVSVIVITGSEKAFAAGADIKEMKDITFSEAYASDWFAGWDAVKRVRKPIIAAVSGFALGGGCELAMMCDILLASDTAKFGQPEIKLGVLPGMGGSQRLTRAVGKAKAMDMCLTGRTIDAEEAERAGLVSRIIPADELLDETKKIATEVAGMSTPATMMVKESINRSFETSLSEGILFERRVFHATFATHDQSEGMAAFAEKRKPNFTDS